VSRNVGKGLSLDAALYPRRAQISSASRRNSEITEQFCLFFAAGVEALESGSRDCVRGEGGRVVRCVQCQWQLLLSNSESENFRGVLRHLVNWYFVICLYVRCCACCEQYPFLMERDWDALCQHFAWVSIIYSVKWFYTCDNRNSIPGWAAGFFRAITFRITAVVGVAGAVIHLWLLSRTVRNTKCWHNFII
jgi:hypothetical protein